MAQADLDEFERWELPSCNLQCTASHVRQSGSQTKVFDVLAGIRGEVAQRSLRRGEHEKTPEDGAVEERATFSIALPTAEEYVVLPADSFLSHKRALHEQSLLIDDPADVSTVKHVLIDCNSKLRGQGKKGECFGGMEHSRSP